MRLHPVLYCFLVACAADPATSPDQTDEPPIGGGDGKADGTGCATVINGQTIHVCNLSEVSPGIYRGARPDARGLGDLASILGIQTDIDLEKIESAITTETKQTAALGITLKREPMSYVTSPSDAQIDRILAELNNPDLQPVFVHCQLGADRTGLVVALDRVLYDNWAPADASKEMMDRGFHRIWLGLSHYFEERTGYDP